MSSQRRAKPKPAESCERVRSDSSTALRVEPNCSTAGRSVSATAGRGWRIRPRVPGPLRSPQGATQRGKRRESPGWVEQRLLAGGPPPRLDGCLDTRGVLLCRGRRVAEGQIIANVFLDQGAACETPGVCGLAQSSILLVNTHWVRLFFVEEFLPYSWAFLPADASLQCSFRGDSNQASAYPRLSGGQPSLETVPNTVGLSPSGALPSGHSRGVLVRCRGKGGRPAMAVTTGFQRRTFDVPRTGVPCIDLPSRAPCAAADAVFADAKALLSSSEARQMSESELERELHRRGQDLVRKLLQGHRDQRSPKEAAGPAEDTSGVECSEPREHESHAETASGTMQVVGLGCARRGHDGLHRLDAALNLLPERYLVEMRRRVTIATASRAPPRTPWKPPWYSTSSTWQRRRGVRCSSPAHRRACRHLVRDPMGVDRRAVTLGCSCGGPQPPRAAGALMRTETSHEAREDQRKSPIGR